MDTVMGVLVEFRSNRMAIEDAAKRINALTESRAQMIASTARPDADARDGFAAAALVGLLNYAHDLTDDDLAERAYNIAGAMLVRRAQK
jgi:hypothetical protein